MELSRQNTRLPRNGLREPLGQPELLREQRPPLLTAVLLPAWKFSVAERGLQSCLPPLSDAVCPPRALEVSLHLVQVMDGVLFLKYVPSLCWYKKNH